MNSPLNKLLFALLLLLPLSTERASAYYDPGVQRWLNRDPIGEAAVIRTLVLLKTIDKVDFRRSL